MTAPKRVSLVLFFTVLTATIHSQSLVPELVFMNPVLQTGSGAKAAGQDGAVYLFSNVGFGIDAKVTITGRSSSLVTLSTPDLAGPDQDAVNGTGYDNAWQPRVNYNNGNAPANSRWWMEFRVSFVKHSNNSQPVSVNQFFVSGLDIDGDGQKLAEFQSYYKMDYFTLEQLTSLTAAGITGCVADNTMAGKEFDGKDKNYPGITPTATDAMVTSFYTNTSSFIVRVGASTADGNSLAADRMYALWFKSFTYDVPVSTPLPLTLVAFNAQLNQQDVKLNWVTTLEENTSHFTVQRSTDGLNYDDAAIIFTDGNSDIRKEYKYTDHLPSVNAPIYYYRLKEVDLDEKFQYSETVFVKTSGDKSKVTVYPDPVAGDLRVTVPDSWQTKTIAYSVFNERGSLVRQVVSEDAGQTQTLHVQDLPAGIYIIKTASGKDVAVQPFIKTH